MLEMEKNNLNVPFTIVKKIDPQFSDENKQYQWTMSINENSELSVQVSNINLKQSPRETLTMQFNIFKVSVDNMYGGYDPSSNYVRVSQPNGISKMFYCYKYKLKLEFSNYLHEFNQNYSYEVICRTDQQESKYLFCYTGSRLKECISSEEIFFSNHSLLGELKPNLYFYIRRLSDDSNATVDDEKTNGVMNTLRNTGYDIVLDCKGGHLSAHRAILSQNSDVFQAMFSSEMKESQNGIVNMLDFEARVVKKMLDYLYTRQLGELEDMTQSLFKLAHRYQLNDLCHRCEEYFIFNVKVNNDSIVDILNLADIYELKNLKEYALNFSNRHEEELIKIASYQEYLIQSINLENVVTMLLLAEKSDVESFKMKIFDFIKNNYQQMVENQHFLELFESKGHLMKEITVYMYKGKV